ncbi:hypothetical protein DKP76_07470 [Falsochrobactrum shanghaiense]|uniref:Uncharacterized protein n=1 Tax=Falsochrobactrum shanghaiense TaxID=2201899 RepID=A0A316JUP8_9HYPH|nr:hypothetical protein DKP76_07470 [Falsochrobactrum shanghaiense]
MNDATGNRERRIKFALRSASYAFIKGFCTLMVRFAPEWARMSNQRRLFDNDDGKRRAIVLQLLDGMRSQE